jgi:hypothetical protein
MAAAVDRGRILLRSCTRQGDSCQTVNTNTNGALLISSSMNFDGTL